MSWLDVPLRELRFVVLDPEEIEGLRRLSTCLATLGWSPGQPVP